MRQGLCAMAALGVALCADGLMDAGGLAGCAVWMALWLALAALLALIPAGRERQRCVFGIKKRPPSRGNGIGGQDVKERTSCTSESYHEGMRKARGSFLGKGKRAGTRRAA